MSSRLASTVLISTNWVDVVFSFRRFARRAYSSNLRVLRALRLNACEVGKMISYCALSSNPALAFSSPVSRSGRSLRVLTVTARAISSSGGHGLQPVELPGGATWWLGLASATAADELLYGPGFTICRPNVRTGQQGLVRSLRPIAPTRYAGAATQQQRGGRSALVPLPRQRPGALGLACSGAVSSNTSNLALDIASGAVVIDTEFELVDHQGPGCLSIVPVALETEAEEGHGPEGEVPENHKHPRRTLLVRAGCRR